jgi:hypothetical protein
MSQYNTITSIGESPLNEDILYVGTDDGLIQVSADGGETWRRIEVGSLPGVPDRAFVNDIRADLFDEDTVYVALDNHKYGDYKPYLLKSTNRGRSWRSITGDLPDRHLVWRVVQDHEDPQLMFTATEFGLFFTVNGGKSWVELNAGVPTISFRDVVIQRRENDVVAASFGRGFFILDDYSPLRDVDEDALEDEAMLWTPGRRTWWYIPRHPLSFSEGGSQGHSYYRAPNPPFGATFTYYLAETEKSLREERQEEQEPKLEDWEDTPFVGFDTVERERREVEPGVWLTVRDSEGNVVRRLEGPATKGFHRVTWDLKYPAMTNARFWFEDEGSGFLAAPGTYTVSLSKRVRGETTELVAPQEFEVQPLHEGALEGAPTEEVVAFWNRVSSIQRAVVAANETLSDFDKKLEELEKALDRARGEPTALQNQWAAIRTEVMELREALSGNQSRAEVGAEGPPTVQSRLGKLLVGVGLSTYGPTQTHRQVAGYIEEEFSSLRERINRLQTETIPAFEQALLDADAPWTPGQPVPAP